MDCVIRWDNGEENIVYKNEIKHVEKGKPIHIGSRIVMNYKKKLYYGEVIEIQTQSHEEATKLPIDETSSEEDKSTDDPDYVNPSCEVPGCSEEVYAGCTNQGGLCLALMCNDHFLACGDLDCFNDHQPITNEDYYKQQKNGHNDLIIEGNLCIEF